MVNIRRTTSLISMVVALSAPLATAVTFDVSASGDGMGLTEALELAEPGDSVFLADGTYDTALVSYRDGEADDPITIEGSRDAIINGDHSSRSVLINHSFITLRGFTVEGKIGSGSGADDYINKCVYVDGGDSELDGFVMEGLLVQNCGGECVRLKNNVINAEVIDNTIQTCGIHDYEFESEDKNGEGIYIGTSSNQWVDDTPDYCFNNLVRGNTISTNGNECVDIKEGSRENILEENSCTDQLDTESGCYNVRGDDNTIRYNTATGCVGTCVRVGGWDVDGHPHGQGNNVYGNDFSDCGEGSIKVETEGQGDICSNTCEGDSCSPIGSELGDIAEAWDKTCGDNNSGSTSTEVDDDDGSTFTEENDDESTVTESDDDGSTVTEENDDESTVTEDDDDDSTVTEVDDDDESTVTNENDDESTVTESDDDGSTVTEENDDESTVTEDDDDDSTVTEVDDDDESTVTESDDDESTVTESDDDGSTVTEEDDDGSAATEEDDDESTVTEDDDDDDDNDDRDGNRGRRDRGGRV